MKPTRVFLLSLLTACAAPTTGGVHHPSAAQYEARAAGHEQAASEHRENYDPNARATVERCISRHNINDIGACWTEESNPTAAQLEEAKKHQQAAERLRHLSAVMRDAEARECAGLSEDDIDTSPFAHVRDITNIEPFDVYVGKTLERQGAVVTFRAVPGMTLEWLQKVVRCQLARNDAMGHDVPDLAYCPLVPPNVQATVKKSELGFVIEVSSGNKATIQEILHRADTLRWMRVHPEIHDLPR